MKINSSILYLNTQYNKISYDQDPSKENQLSPQNLKKYINTPNQGLCFYIQHKSGRFKEPIF